MKFTAFLFSFFLAIAASAVNPGDLGVGQITTSRCSSLSVERTKIKGISLCLATVSGDFNHRYFKIVRKDASHRTTSDLYRVEEVSASGSEITFKLHRFDSVLLEASTHVAGRGKMWVRNRHVDALELRMNSSIPGLGNLLIEANYFQ